ncbi:MAG: PAS domain S-box protein [Candidatus Saganbacteria bacterium]|nr:PAS domain S-box protein [Candidatus Saganbacteria bacterium]
MNYTFAIISLFGFLLSGVAAMLVLVRNYRNLLNWLFFLYASMVALFNLCDFLSKITPYIARSRFYNDLSVIFWLWFLFFVLHFSVVLANKYSKKMWTTLIAVFFTTTIIFNWITLRTTWIYLTPVLTEWGYSAEPGLYFGVFAAYSVLLVLLTAWNFWLTRQNVDDIRLVHQANVLLVGVLVGMCIGLIGDVILPLLGLWNVTLVPIATIVYIAFFGLAMFRYGLLSISPSTVANSVLNTMPNLLVVTDLDHNISMVNEFCLKVLGYQEKEIIGLPMKSLIAGENSSLLCGLISQELSRKGFVKERRLQLKTRAGLDIPVSMDASRALDRFGNQLGCVLIFRDVSDIEKLLAQQKEAIDELTRTKERMLSILEDTTETRDRADEATKKLARAYEDLKAVDKMKTEFLSVVSHELRTPITPIKGYTSMLLSDSIGKLSEEQKRAVQVIQKEGDHLLGLIDSVLDVSRMSYGRPLKLAKEPVLIRTLAQELKEVMAPEAGMRNISIEVELPPDFPTIIADPTKIRRLLTNLLGNSLKFTPKGGHVTITGASGQDEVEIRVVDDGIGLARDNLEKVFDKFYQVDSSYTRAVGGVGLGLAICKEIVETHGGKIRAISDGLGKGAAIAFTLPIGG